jgi:hypothetical protein
MDNIEISYQDQIWDELNKSEAAKREIFSSVKALMATIESIEKAADILPGDIK